IHIPLRPRGWVGARDGTRPGSCPDLADSIQGRGTQVPSLVMDLPVLHPFVRELAESERFRAFLEELPETRARVSEPALPLVVSAIYEELGRPLVVLAPEDAD